MARKISLPRKTFVKHLSPGFARLITLGCLAVLWSPHRLAAQQSPEITGILARLDRLESENRALADEVRALRAQLSAAHAADTAAVADQTPPAPGTATQAVTATPEERLDILEHRVEEQAQTKVEASQRFPIRLAGMALFNSFLNSKQNDNLDYPTTAAPGTDRGGLTMRQTILGLEYNGPQTFFGGAIHGSIYMDFYQGAAPLQEWLRFRTGAIQIDWKTRSIMAGVDKPIFNPRDPSSLAQVGVSPLTGTGNLWLWLPQVRLEQDFAVTSASGLRLRVGGLATHEVNAYAGAPPNGRVEIVRPALEGRLEAYHNLDQDRKLELAIGFHTSTTHASGYSVPSNLISADWFFNPWKRMEFSGAFFSGENVAQLGTGAVNQGYYILGGFAEPIHSLGGWGQLTFHLAPRIDWHLFTGQQAYRASDLTRGGVNRNLLFGMNLFFHIAPNVILAPEVSQLRAYYLGQGLRINNHYDLALAYLF